MCGIWVFINPEAFAFMSNQQDAKEKKIYGFAQRSFKYWNQLYLT